jgi:hypothetical protein
MARTLGNAWSRVARRESRGLSEGTCMVFIHAVAWSCVFLIRLPVVVSLFCVFSINRFSPQSMGLL